MICIFFALTFTDKFPPKQKINQLVNVNVNKKRVREKKTILQEYQVVMIVYITE